MILVCVTFFMEGLQITQIIAAASLEADDMVDFPQIFLEQFAAHRAAKLLPGGNLL